MPVKSLAKVTLSPPRLAGHGPDMVSAVAPKTFWLNDFAWDNGLVVRKTGVRLAITWPLINEIINWAVYLVILAAVAIWARVLHPIKGRLWFAPDRPRPWYLMRGAALWAGFGLARTEAEADATFYFDDTTVGVGPNGVCRQRFNFNCTDISKSYVAKVFAEVFGYPLALDPRTAVGEIIEKPEKNGVHGGRVVMAPVVPRAGYTYQRVVDTCDETGFCQDLRTPCAGGEPVLVWIKSKTANGRFSIDNRRAVLADPKDIYSDDERQKIREFTARMGLDWGGLDILRDRGDGRIYIVDVNKTDLGPLIALSWRDKITSMNRIAQALTRLVQVN